MGGGGMAVSSMIQQVPHLAGTRVGYTTAATATGAGACHHALGMHRAAVEDYQATLEAQSCLDGLMASGEQGGTAVSTDLVQARNAGRKGWPGVRAGNGLHRLAACFLLA